MSRIYEALQRADREQTLVQGAEVNQDADTIEVPSIEERPAIRAEFELETIARHPWKPSAASLPTLDDRGETVEQFRSLRTHIYQSRYEAPLKTILISSGMPAEGKTFVAANLAINLARSGDNSILLIDGDLRRPSLHTLLGAPNEPGLSEFLAGSAELNDILQRNRVAESADSNGIAGIANLTFIPAGRCGDNSSEIIANHRIDDLVAALAPQFDFILIDSPPVLVVTDAVDLARAADAVLLVARGSRTPFDVAQRAQAAFSSSRILGFVLNAVKEMPRSVSNYYYYGEYDSSTPSKRQNGRQRKG